MEIKEENERKRETLVSVFGRVCLEVSEPPGLLIFMPSQPTFKTLHLSKK